MTGANCSLLDDWLSGVSDTYSELETKHLLHSMATDAVAL